MTDTIPPERDPIHILDDKIEKAMNYASAETNISNAAALGVLVIHMWRILTDMHEQDEE